MKYYKAVKSSVSPCIEEVEIEKETDKCVWIKGRKNNKLTDYECFCPTWEDAHALLKVYFYVKLQAAKRRVKDAETLHEKVKSLKHNQS